jgi:hypothetical protein
MISAKRKLAAGAAGLVVLAGAGGAYAATQQNGSTAKPDPAAEQKAFLDDLANRLHVSSDDLTSAIKGAAEDRIDAAVTAGTLTKDQGDAIKKRIESATGLPLGPGLGLGLAGGKGPRLGAGFGPGPGGLRFAFGPGKSLDAAAKFLGLTDAQLRSQLNSGKTLAEIAKAQNKSVDDLKTAIKTAVSDELAQQVKAGHLTDQQRTNILSNLDAGLDRLVNGQLPKGPRMFRGFRPPNHP